MKKISFSLFFPLWGIGGLFAQATVTPISVDYDRHEVKFRVAWNAATAANNRVWVWVDFCSVAGATPGTFAPATISPVSIAGGSYDGENGRGFYIYGNPSTVTAALSGATGTFNWCAYGSNFPPNAVDNTSGGYDLRGTPPFIITTSAGTTEVNAYTYSGGTITALTDATGCPGALCGKNNESSGLLNCCINGTTNCSGTCKTDSTYTTNDGECTGSCNTAYIQLRDQCGTVINAKYSTYANESCMDGCALNCTNCITLCKNSDYKYASIVPERNECYCQETRCAQQASYRNQCWWTVYAGIWNKAGCGYIINGCDQHTLCN
ncbi:MAG: hypothetical protein LBU42_08820 [Prevotellaceae bacterium]|jgi:hypothetical protein|nr:hypothetical protein [Prevotellaceae bacterium]